MPRKIYEIKIKDMRNLRFLKKKTSQSVADELGMHKETYLRYERKSVIPVDYLIPFAKFIDASAEELGLDEDYELYTGCLLAINLTYHNITVDQLAQKLVVAKNIAQVYQSDYGKCVYHYKEIIKEMFNPLILPAIVVPTVEDTRINLYGRSYANYEYPIGNNKAIHILTSNDILNNTNMRPTNKKYWTKKSEKNK